MRDIDAATLSALSGSRAGDSLTVNVWYAGELAYPDPLNVSNWSFSWDTTRQVQSLSITVQDPDGTLAPWLLEDPLGVGGSRLQVRWEVGGAGTVNMGWYRIANPKPSEQWHTYVIDHKGHVSANKAIPKDKRMVMVSGGATISITAYDLAIMIKNDRLLAPESPVGASPTVIGEITRLVGDICQVVTTAGVVDEAVSKQVVYERERLDAVQDLCKRIGCDYRMNGEGQLEVYPLDEQAPVAVLEGGPDGLLVGVEREQNLEGLYNIFVVDGTRQVTAKDGSQVDVPVRAVAMITTGPLSIYGEHGRVPEFYSSPMVNSQAAAEAYAQKMMLTQLAGLTVDLRVDCLPLPHLQQGEWVQVGSPVVGGATATLVGRVQSMELSGAGVPDKMRCVVQCSYSDVQAVLGGIDRG